VALGPFERKRRDAERERDRTRQERSAVVARPGHLDTIAVDQPGTWQRVDELIATKSHASTTRRVQLLVDLCDLGERDGDTAGFRQRPTELRAVHARKPSLLDASTWQAPMPEQVRMAASQARTTRTAARILRF